MTVIEGGVRAHEGAPPHGRPPLPPRPPRSRRGQHPPPPPLPPRRPPRPVVAYAPLTPAQALARGILALLAALAVTFAFHMIVVSQITHLASQQSLSDAFRAELAEGTAPVSEGDFNDVLLPDGAPVALLSIPKLGLHEIVSEGTSSSVLTAGPGHRRDTVLPGQAGVSVLMGRAAAFGGPFGRIQTLQPGDRFTVRTGQGESTFAVIGVRYAGDQAPPAPVAGESRLLLLTARGPAYMPAGIAYVDAVLVGPAQPAGARQTTPLTLPPSDKAFATDTSTVWALVFALQFLIVAEIAAVWAFRRVGAQKTWVVFVPVLLLASLLVADQLVRLLPNLL